MLARKGVKTPTRPGCSSARRNELLGGRLQRRQTSPSAVLDLQLEAPGSPQPSHRRRGKDRDSGLLDIGQTLPQVLSDARAHETMRDALFKRLQRGKDGAGIGAIRACRRRKAGNADRIAHTWRLERQF